MPYLILLCSAALVLQAAPGLRGAEPPTSFPPIPELTRRVRAGLSQGFDAQPGFTYLERRRDIDVSVLGKVSVGPIRTFEVYPSSRPGQTYKRLIEVDGQPLSEAELAKRDAEHQRNLQRAARRVRNESARQRASRLREEAEERRQREAMLDDAAAVFEPSFAGHSVIDGQRVWVVDLRPRRDAGVSTREGEWMTNFEGRLWVATADYQIARIELRAVRDVTVGWGVVGRIHKGSQVTFARHHYQGTWLPSELSYTATGRTLLVRPFSVAASTTFSDYRRVGDRSPTVN